MLATGRDRLERMRDGRVVYIGAERVDDVTAHPAFHNGACSSCAAARATISPAACAP